MLHFRVIDVVGDVPCSPYPFVSAVSSWRVAPPWPTVHKPQRPANASSRVLALQLSPQSISIMILECNEAGRRRWWSTTMRHIFESSL